MARNAEPGNLKSTIARAIGAALFSCGHAPAVLLVGGDDRIAAYPPSGTDRPRRGSDRLLIAVCAERHGMVAALTRIVTTRRDDELARRTGVPRTFLPLC